MYGARIFGMISGVSGSSHKRDKERQAPVADDFQQLNTVEEGAGGAMSTSQVSDGTLGLPQRSEPAPPADLASSLPAMISAPVEFIAPGSLTPNAELEENVPHPSGPTEIGSSVSNWLSSLFNTPRDASLTRDSSAKLLGLPTIQIDQSSGRNNVSPVCYVTSAGAPVEVRTQPETSTRQTDLDFTPIQLTVHNGQRTISPVDLQLTNQQVVQEASGLTSALPAINDQVLLAGSVLDRNLQEGVFQQTRVPVDLDNTRQVVTDEQGQVHVLLQDLNHLQSSKILPVKLENKQGLGQRGFQDMRSLQLGGLVGSLGAGRNDPGYVTLSRPPHELQAAHELHVGHVQQTPKTRWKPNAAQLTLLERHFNSGYTKPTPELFAAVKCAGEAKEAQVSVWLKNRLARSKRQGNKPPTTSEVVIESGSDNQNNGDNEATVQSAGLKRAREELDDEAFDDFSKLSQAVMGEVSQAIMLIPPNEISTLAREVSGARKVCCYGVGREKLVMKSFVMRLRHMGVDAYMVGEINTPVVSSGDIMLASAGPSFYNTVNAICLAAIRAGTRVVAFTAHQTAPLPFADRVVRIPTSPIPSNVNKSPKTEGGSALVDNPNKIMQLGSAYEVTLWMVFECLSRMIQKRLGVRESDMLSRHTNLE